MKFFCFMPPRSSERKREREGKGNSGGMDCWLRERERERNNFFSVSVGRLEISVNEWVGGNIMWRFS